MQNYCPHFVVQWKILLLDYVVIQKACRQIKLPKIKLYSFVHN